MPSKDPVVLRRAQVKYRMTLKRRLSWARYAATTKGILSRERGTQKRYHGGNDALTF